MKKVAIVTIVSRNYGNRLQNFALQEVLTGLGHKVRTLYPYPYHVVRHTVKCFVMNAVHSFTGKFPDTVWDQFDRNIHWGKDAASDKKINDRYDCFVAGSDQIWNPTFQVVSERELLTFAAPEKRIAYAASIGLDHFPEADAARYAKEWKKFRKISVREEQAAAIVLQLAQIRPPVVLDPTMLLTKEQWKQYIRHRVVDGKYYVKYFLGERTNCFESYSKNLAEKENAACIDITNDDGSLKSGIGPLEFLSMLYYSAGVFTDSFHGTVFSILFGKPFMVFRRPFQEGYGDMNSRIDTLMRSFDLMDHYATGETELDQIDMNFDAERVGKILDSKRKESIAFLREALSES